MFPWGLFYPNELVPKDVAYVYRGTGGRALPEHRAVPGKRPAGRVLAAGAGAAPRPAVPRGEARVSDRPRQDERRLAGPAGQPGWPGACVLLLRSHRVGRSRVRRQSAAMPVRSVPPGRPGGTVPGHTRCAVAARHGPADGARHRPRAREHADSARRGVGASADRGRTGPVDDAQPLANHGCRSTGRSPPWKSTPTARPAWFWSAPPARNGAGPTT